jgi:hypothetical protein
MVSLTLILVFVALALFLGVTIVTKKIFRTAYQMVFLVFLIGTIFAIYVQIDNNSITPTIVKDKLYLLDLSDNIVGAFVVDKEGTELVSDAEVFVDLNKEYAQKNFRKIQEGYELFLLRQHNFDGVKAITVDGLRITTSEAFELLESSTPTQDVVERYGKEVVDDVQTFKSRVFAELYNALGGKK